MRYALAALLAVHGLIHLLGFAKAFGLSGSSPLRTAIPRPLGLAWLGAALVLGAAAGGLAGSGRWWWLAAALGIAGSQALILTAWSDAKAGTLVNAVLMFPIVIAALGHAPWSFRSIYDRDVEAGLGRKPVVEELLTEPDLAHLPDVVRQYLEFVGAVGKPKVWNYRLRMRGAIRSGSDDRFMPMEVWQQSFVDPATRLFLAESSMLGVPVVALHRYVGPEATFRVRVASILTVVDARGAEMNQSETVTLLNDMFLLAPATLIDRRIRWEELDSSKIRATWSNARHTVSAEVTFDASGALVDFVSDDRYRTADGKTYERLRWSTPVEGWRVIRGRRLPAVGEARWGHPKGEFVYARFEILDAEYNASER